MEVCGEEGGDVACDDGWAEWSSSSGEWKASSNGQCWNLLPASASEAHAVAPRAPWSLSMCVQEFVAAAQ